MTHYDEMVQTAKTARKNWIRRNDSAREFIREFLEGFTNYCQMPSDRLKLLPWNEETQVFQAKTDEVFGLHQAVSFNEESDEWRVGICLRLNPLNEIPPLAAVCGMFVTEKDSQYSVRIGEVEPQRVDLNIPSMREKFFASVVADVKKSFEEPMKARATKYGFQVQTA